MTKKVVIIGNGVAGATAARFIRMNSDHEIVMISDEADFFFSRPALMYLYMGHLRFEQTKPYEDSFWTKNRIERIRDRVEAIDVPARSLTLRRGDRISFDVLILATGSVPKFFDWPGQHLDGVQGLYHLQDVERMGTDTKSIKQAVVVGGGLIGIEMVEMLASRGIHVTFLVREASYFDYVLPPEESAMINEEIVRHGVDLRLNTTLREALPDASGRVRAVVTGAGEEIPCQFLGLTTGVTPNIGLIESSLIHTNKGVLVNAFFETNVPEIYAIGDCAEFLTDGIGYRRIDQLWYTGRQHGKTVAETICGRRTAYEKPIYFNSAKFFGIEYQTYGTVEPRPPAGVRSLLWADKRHHRLLRIHFEAESRRVVGFNALGLRLRHEVCERWLWNGQTIDHVVEQLPGANFDPEFSPRLEPRPPAMDMAPLVPRRMALSSLPAR
jgi:NAD(P)H-nitrite reductase large subunit